MSPQLRLSAFCVYLLGVLMLWPPTTVSVRACGPYCCVGDCDARYADCVDGCTVDYGEYTPAWYNCINNGCIPSLEQCHSTCCETSC
jgi:hypothetical protein